MTSSQMKYEFQLLYDSIAGLHAPPYNDREISTLLTLAQERVIKNRLSPSADNKANTLDETEKRKSEFDQLITNAKVTSYANTDDNLTNGYFFNLPTNFLYALMERADIKFTSKSGCYNVDDTLTDIWVKPMSYDMYLVNKNNPFKKPYEEIIWRFNLESDPNYESPTTSPKRVELLTDGKYIITSYNIRYIKKPNPIIVGTLSQSKAIDGFYTPTDCQLDSFLHREIVRLAVEDAIEISKDTQRYQTFKIQNQSIE